MDRRAAIVRMLSAAGGIAIGGQFLTLTGCGPALAPRTEPFSPTELALLDEIGETIIPTTDTPGAKAAGVSAFMALAARECYDDAAYESFRRGLREIEHQSDDRYARTFAAMTPADRTAMLNDLDREQRRYTRQKKSDDPPHYFRLMKELAVIGYFTSEVGATKALRYVETPGAFRGDVPYQKGERAWYNPARRIS